MQFQNPIMIYGFLALAIPVIIHLLNLQRYRKVVFSTLRFLKEAQKESKQKLKLRNWLLLFVRCLFIAFLVLMFMDPVIPNENGVSEEAYEVIIDNSGSMSEVQANGQGLLQFAKESVWSWFKDDQVSFSNEISINENIKTDNVLVVGDLQKGSILGSNYAGNIDFVKLQNRTTNTIIDSVWFSKPMLVVGENELNIKLNNRDEQKAVKLSFLINDVLSSSISEELLENQTKVLISQVSLNDGINKIEIRINDNGLRFDNSFYMSCIPQSEVQVAVVSEGTSPISRVLANEELFKVTQSSYSNYDPLKLSESSIVFLDETNAANRSILTNLKKYVESGGVLFVSIDSLAVTHWNSVFTTINVRKAEITDKRESQLNFESYMYKDVLVDLSKDFDKPKFSKGYIPVTYDESFIKVPGLGSVLSSHKVGEGRVILLSTPLNTQFTNLHKHALFVPTIYNSVFNSLSKTQTYARIGDPVHRSTDTLQNLVLQDANQFINLESRQINNQHYFQLPDDFYQVGFFNLLEGETKVGALANNYAKAELQPVYLEKEDLQQLFPKAKVEVYEVEETNDWQSFANNFEEATPLWKYCLILSLVFLFVEIVLIRVLGKKSKTTTQR